MTGEGGREGAPRTERQVARYRAALHRAAGAALPSASVA
jgi:hypothetical protein